MRRTSDIRNLEMRIARLERLERQASMKIEVLTDNGKKMMTVKDFLSSAKTEGQHYNNCEATVELRGPRMRRSAIIMNCDDMWHASVDLFDFINAIEADNPKDVQALMRSNGVRDDGDVLGMATVAEDYLVRSLGRHWTVSV